VGVMTGSAFQFSLENRFHVALLQFFLRWHAERPMSGDWVAEPLILELDRSYTLHLKLRQTESPEERHGSFGFCRPAPSVVAAKTKLVHVRPSEHPLVLASMRLVTALASDQRDRTVQELAFACNPIIMTNHARAALGFPEQLPVLRRVRGVTLRAIGDLERSVRVCSPVSDLFDLGMAGQAKSARSVLDLFIRTSFVTNVAVPIPERRMNRTRRDQR